MRGGVLGMFLIFALVIPCAPAGADKPAAKACGDVVATKGTAYKVVARAERCGRARIVARTFTSGGGKRLSDDSEGGFRVRIRGYICKPSEEFIFCHRGKRRLIRWSFYPPPGS